jgi:hypothetical protein
MVRTSSGSGSPVHMYTAVSSTPPGYAIWAA